MCLQTLFTLPRRTTRPAPKALALLLWAGLVAGTMSVPVRGQVIELPGSDYGKVALPLRESLGGAVRDVRSRGTIFEPIAQLRRDDRLARLARSVGRIDILIPGDAGGRLVTCTGTLVTARHVLTNHHCALPNAAPAERMSFLLDYLNQDGDGALRLELEPLPVESDRQLDFAVLRLKAPLPEDIAPVRLVARSVRPRDRLRLIHHPAGQPMVMTQFRCKAAPSTRPDGASIRHTCDTMPGSSGALVLDHDTHVAVGIHHTGGLTEHDPNSYNSATSMQALVDRSRFIRELVEAGGRTENSLVQSAQPPRDNSVPDGINERSPGVDGTRREEQQRSRRLNDIINQ